MEWNTKKWFYFIRWTIRQIKYEVNVYVKGVKVSIIKTWILKKKKLYKESTLNWFFRLVSGIYSKLLFENFGILLNLGNLLSNHMIDYPDHVIL